VKKVLIGLIFSVAVLALAAGYINTTDLFKPKLHHSPLIIAHRAGGGQWPQNSRTAVLNSIAGATKESAVAGLDGIEIDIVLTRDRIPVLSHDPWVHTTLCTTASGTPIDGRILIRDLTLTELQSQYLCGGVADKEFSEVIPKAEKVMTLAEVIEALKAVPQMILYLDVKIDGDLTAGAADYAGAISTLWAAAGISNPLYIEGPSAASLKAYRSAIGKDFTAVLSYPPFSAAENFTFTVIKARWLTRLRLRTPLSKARAAKAGAVAGPTQVITWDTARQARDNGVAVILFSPNSKKEFDRYCTWPVDVLITDYPELGHCS
jgi:glycerophosphoryl diester phosphodiesterase